MGVTHIGVEAAAAARAREEDRAGGAATRTRIAASLGLLSVVVTFGGLSIHGYPAVGARAREIAQWATTTNARQFAMGIYIEALGSLLFLLFAAWLWSVAREAEEGAGWLSTAGFSAAVLNVVAGLVANGVWWAVLDGGQRGMDGQTLATVRDIAQHIYDLSLLLPGVFLLLIGSVLVRTRALPRPVGVAAVPIGAGILIPPAAQEVYLLFFLWVIVLCLYLLARPRASSGAVVGAPATGAP